MEPCPHRPPCPGCPHYGEGALPADLRARLEALAPAGAPVPFHRGAPSGHRRRARLMVRGRPGAPKLGLFQAGSHRIVHVPDCRVHHPLVNDVAAAVRDAACALRIEPYAERPHRGLLRAVQVVVARSDERAQVTLVGNTSDPAVLRPLGDAVSERMGDRIGGLFGNGNPERTNTILGPHWLHFAGAALLEETLGGAVVCFPPGAFGQSHLDLAARLVERVHAEVPDGACVTEYYAGCGALGLGLLRRADRVRMNERAEAGIAGLRAGLARRPADERARAEWDDGPAEDAPHLLDGADVVIVDPPRRGLDAGLCAAIARAAPARLLYLSCGLDSFERDHAALTRGGLAVRTLEAWDLFPYTGHVETLARFEPA